MIAAYGKNLHGQFRNGRAAIGLSPRYSRKPNALIVCEYVLSASTNAGTCMAVARLTA
jgi:hypothetical protein